MLSPVVASGGATRLTYFSAAYRVIRRTVAFARS